VDAHAFVEELVSRCRGIEGVTTVAVFGSTASAASARRDEWSDVDFAVFADPDHVAEVSSQWDFLPRPDDIVLAAREHDSGGVVLYADGALAEFGAGRPWEVSDPTCEVLLGGLDLVRVPAPLPMSPENAIRLFLVKLLIGVGRVRRGEVLAGGVHIRSHALAALAVALRGRCQPGPADDENPFDTLRRFEAVHPELGARLATATAQPAETAARALFDLARAELEPGWLDFPSRAADVVAARVGWPVGPRADRWAALPPW
jgi:hypothetical protein